MGIKIKSKTGKEYLLESNKIGGWKVVRLNTGSQETVSASLIKRTQTRLESGEKIPFRKIDYTVAKETAVVHLLKDIIHVDHIKKTYSLIKGVSLKQTLFSWEIINSNVALRYISKSLCTEGIVVPIGLYSFFELEEMEYGTKGEINFLKNKKLYTCRVNRYKNRSGIRIWWNFDLREEINSIFKEIYLQLLKNKNVNSTFSKNGYIRFKKIKNDFHISMISQLAVERDINSYNIENEILFKEGKKKSYHGIRYEINHINRKKAMQIHGTICFGCGFDFEKKYGKRGTQFIEVHHIKPLSHLKKEMLIDPATDLVPLCSNCHRMVHRFPDDILTIAQLKKIINKL